MTPPDPVPTSDPTASESKMLPVEQWDEVIGRLSGKVHRGIEKIKSAQVLAALKCSGNKEYGSKRAGIAMRSHGWLGPKMLRFADGTHGSGYWRPWHPVARADVDDEAASGQPSMSALPSGQSLALSEASLPEALEQNCRLGFGWARKVLCKPIDPDNGNLLRAQGQAATLMVTSQLRADEARLRRQQSGDVLDRLEKLLRETEATIPLEPTALPPLRQKKAEEPHDAP